MNLSILHLLMLLLLLGCCGCEETKKTSSRFTPADGEPPSIPAGHSVYAMGLTREDAFNGNIESGDVIDVVAKSKDAEDELVLASGVQVYHTFTGSKSHELIVSVVVTDEMSHAINNAIASDGILLRSKR